jgi:thymidylate synthase ThyX
MAIEAKVVADSFWYHEESATCNRLTTLQLKYPRFIHAEFMTHRVLSRNASSSRAIPVMKMLKQVWNDPAMPIHWGANQSGMQAKAELSDFKAYVAEKLWRGAGKLACGAAYLMNKVGLHKQVANRILEPWQYIHVIVTATEWKNFMDLRNHPDAQPEIHELAMQIAIAMEESEPVELGPWDWHLPYVTQLEHTQGITYDVLKALSAARCARVSYLTHDGLTPNIQNDIKLHDRLVGSAPIHASPVEHQARPSGDNLFHKNFKGWIQYREEVEQQNLKSR